MSDKLAKNSPKGIKYLRRSWWQGLVKLGLSKIEQWGTGDGDVSIVEMRALIRVGFYPFKPSIVENVPDAVI